ncbi:hypothetical protein HELRODRAFT_185666 [Helobdella robusta]|uniref:Fe2OG dioxygenase domain-containing protein n=1 Tax=Helobdella robusta TaxID=6412 RepID=T1FN42_HELRO|nr:hypothetical protein HELRODRAFT_185666 [Helobdella robusta]ESO03064.1 hypothetical protein HELRODRAFT_185666 [Helobdella robusta]
MFNLEEFQKKGFVILPNFISEEVANELKLAALNLVKKPDGDNRLAFSTSKSAQLYRDAYFLESNDKIRLFYEPSAFDEAGEIKIDHENAVNKIGHALHILDPTFRKISTDEKIKDVMRTLKYEQPTIVQSMYIFKQPNIGNEVPAHQDATYLHTTPLNGVGLWLALDDADENNGCLHFIPGSHLSGLHFETRLVNKDGNASFTTSEMKDRYKDEEFVSAPVKKGSLVLIDGLVVHKSDNNKSDRSRNAFTLHIYDAAQAQWDPLNWLQPSSLGNFERLY